MHPEISQPLHLLLQEELADALRRVEKQYPKDHVLYRCLMRGIGFHHFGLPAAYRQAVEVCGCN